MRHGRCLEEFGSCAPLPALHVVSRHLGTWPPSGHKVFIMDLCVTVLITVMTTGFRALVSLLHNYVRCQQAWGEPKLLEYPARLFASAGAWILPNTHILGKTSAFPKRKEWASATKNATGAWDLESQAVQRLGERERISKMLLLGALTAPVPLLSFGLLLILHQWKLEWGQFISWYKVYYFYYFSSLIF